MIKLGQEVQDRITGFKGIVVAETRYLQGCTRMLVQPKIKKDGTIPDGMQFDEPDLEVIGDGILPKMEKPKKVKPPPGGPHEHTSKITRLG